jgi:hypothetical protein
MRWSSPRTATGNSDRSERGCPERKAPGELVSPPVRRDWPVGCCLPVVVTRARGIAAQRRWSARIYLSSSQAGPVTHGQTHKQQKRLVDWSSGADFGSMVAAIGVCRSGLGCWGSGTCAPYYDDSAASASTPTPRSMRSVIGATGRRWPVVRRLHRSAAGPSAPLDAPVLATGMILARGERPADYRGSPIPVTGRGRCPAAH